jgi:spoIIIJ-associated protein
MQAPMVEDFLTGLLESFGLEGRVVVNVDDEVIVAAIEGEQTEALVGPRGSVMEAIHEITKTVLHRQVSDTARVRIDISGYAERRRQALSIYAGQLIDQVLSEGGETMLEPMSAADRKVIHDTVAAREGVESYSEGEPPRRYVVIATTDEEVEQDSEGWVEAENPPGHQTAAFTEVQEELEANGFESDEDQGEPSSST